MQSLDLEIQSEVHDVNVYCCKGAEASPSNYLVESRGLLVCRFCGMHQENIYVMGWVDMDSSSSTTSGKKRRKCSRPVFDKYAVRTDFNPKRATNYIRYKGLKKRNVWSNPNKSILKREITLKNLCTSMFLNDLISKMAWRILLECLKQHLTVKTRCTVNGLMLASIYFACRIQKKDLFLSDLIGKTRKERKENCDFVQAYPYVLHVVKSMGFVACLDRNMFILEDIYQVGEKMNLDISIMKEAERMMRQASSSLNMLGKRRVPYSAAYLYLAAYTSNVPVDVKQLAVKAGTSPVTINSRCEQIAAILGIKIRKGKGKQVRQYYALPENAIFPAIAA